jgi:SP family arabinose:H+ symporter-like MFS transporter
MNPSVPASGRPIALNATSIKSTIVAATGGLLFGFDTAVISGTTHQLTLQFHLTPASLGITVATALWGTIIGSMLAGLPGDRYGRRDSLKGMAVLYVISAIGCAISWNWWSLVVSRFIGGLAIGGSSVLGPMYIAEIAPASWRGRLVGLFQINVVVGILVAYFSNYVVGLLIAAPEAWRWKLGVSAAPAILFLLLLFMIPRSPRWLASKARTAEARDVLERVGEPDPEAELLEITTALQHESSVRNVRLFSWKYRFPILLAVGVAFFNQILGVNAILYYLNDIFALAGFSSVSSDLQAVAIGVANLAASVLAMSLIDKAGRRTLLLIGSVGVFFCLSSVAYIFATATHQWLLVWALVGFIGFFSFSQGAVIWVYISEVFPNRVRAKGQSLGSFTHWAMNAIVSGLFPVVASASRALPFVFFAAMAIVQFIFVLMVFPETKGISLEEMQTKLGIDD